MPQTKGSELDALLVDVQDWADRNHVLLLSGRLSKAGGVPQIRLDGAAPDAGATFLNASEGATARLLTRATVRLSPQTYEATIAELANIDSAGDDLTAARACKNHIGQVAIVAVRALCTDPPAVLALDLVAPWFSIFFNRHSRRSSSKYRDKDH